MHKDRLPAIAGLARYFMGRAGVAESPQYMSGLWNLSFVRDLLWRVDEPLCGRSEKRNGLGPPSWSWASVNGKVSYWDEPFRCQDIETTSLPLTTWASAAAGSPLSPSNDLLEVLGFLTPAILRYTRTISGEVDPLHYELSYSGRHSYLNANPFSLALSEPDRRVPLFADYCLASEGVDHIEDQAELYCLGNFVGESFTVSLVLRPRKQGYNRLVHYQRVGIVAIPHIGRKVGKGYFYAVRVGGISAAPPSVTLV